VRGLADEIVAQRGPHARRLWSVSFAGLVPVMRLASDAGLGELVAQRVRLPTSIGINPAGKIATIVAGVVAGADSIADLDALRDGGMDELFGQVYAPSTLGSLLREFHLRSCPPARLRGARAADRAGRPHTAHARR